jgi:hypothetical protein
MPKLLAILLTVYLGEASLAGAQDTPTAPAANPNPALESPYAGQPPAPAPYPVAPPPSAYPAPTYPAERAAPPSYPAPAYTVQSREVRPGFRQHDGFYLRMLVGAGVGGTKYKDGLGLREDGSVADSRTLGGGSLTELAIGGAVMENLIVHATLNFAHLDEVKRVGGADYDEEDELSTLVGFVGAGVTYYLMPANVYLTGSFGVGGLSQTSGAENEEHESDTGFGTSVAIGKEWWLGRTGQWGIGVALSGSYYQAPLSVDGIESTYRGHVTGAAFTTTFN